MSGIGSFSQEAYEQLRAAYASELLRADDQENAGVTIGKDSMGVETAAINSMWLDKTGLWKYPDGKGEYQDVEQKQQDLLAILRNDDGEVVIPSGIDDEAELDEVLEEIDEDEDDSDEFDNLTDEEFDQLIDQILTEIEEEDEEETDETAIEEPSAEDISARIQELKAELQALTEGQDEEEEDIDEPEETEGEEEETESDQPEDNDEEDPSNDESD